MEVVTIESEVWQKLNDDLKNITQLLELYVANSKKEKASKKSKTEETLEELDNWVYWEVALKKMGISKQQWWTKYQKVITHRAYAGSTWIYLPSILKFFEDGKIN